MDKPPQRWARMFRIDLEAKKWCEGDCTRLEAFGSDEEHPGKLVLRDDISLIDRLTRERHTALYDPRTRQYEGADTIQDLAYGFFKSTSETRGRCEAGPFAGFPELAVEEPPASSGRP
jgi:hypothetical protein